MPIHFEKKYSEELLVKVWKTEENLEELQTMLDISVHEQKELDFIELDFKKKEYLVTRILLKSILIEAGLKHVKFQKNDHGKPILEHAHISLSHSKDFLCWALHKSKPVGVDLEFYRPQVLKVAHRVFSVKELEHVNGSVEEATKYWCIKEALYKLYGKRGLHFIENLMVHYQKGNYTGKIHMSDQKSSHLIHLEKMDDLYLAVVA